jgi:hypothetical protein
MRFSVQAFSRHTQVPIAAERAAQEDDTEDAPGCATQDQREEDVAGTRNGAQVREEVQVLDCEGYFDEGGGKVVEKGLSEDHLGV